VLAGCGYSLHGNLPEHVQTVAVPVFTNRTAEPAIESFLTQAVVEAFATNGRLRVVNAAQADAILEGEVVATSSRRSPSTRARPSVSTGSS